MSNLTEQQLADELQTASNIEKIRKAVNRVSRQRELEEDGAAKEDELNFDNLDYLEAF